MSQSFKKMTRKENHQRLSQFINFSDYSNSPSSSSREMSMEGEIDCSTKFKKNTISPMRNNQVFSNQIVFNILPQAMTKIIKKRASFSMIRTDALPLSLIIYLIFTIFATSAAESFETSSPAHRYNNLQVTYPPPRHMQQPFQLNSSPNSFRSSNINQPNPAVVPQNWARGLVHDKGGFESLSRETRHQSSSPVSNNDNNQNQDDQPSLASIVRRNTNSRGVQQNNNMMKSVRHIVTSTNPSTNNSQQSNAKQLSNNSPTNSTDDICSDKLCFGLPMGCIGNSPLSQALSSHSLINTGEQQQSGSSCSILITSKWFIDPDRPVSRDILFELIALPAPDLSSNYAAVGFSDNGRMQGLVSECLQYRDAKTQLQIIKLKHSYNIPGEFSNVPVTILSGIKSLGVSWENGYYQCRWIVESAVEFSYEARNGSIINLREDLGYKNYHILLASGEYDEKKDLKSIHTDRVSSIAPVSLAQIGHIKSLGSHILIRIHGSLMIAIWVGLVTLSIVLARYYKNEWANSRISDLAIWFVVHRTLMLTSWFGSIIAVIFAYMYQETYHPVSIATIVVIRIMIDHSIKFNFFPKTNIKHNSYIKQGIHQISGTACLVLTTIQVLGGLFRPSQESSKRAYFNWTHFVCGSLSYLFASKFNNIICVSVRTQ